MRIYLERTDQEKKMKFNGKASALLQKLKINPVTVVIVKNKQVVTEEEQLNDKDDVEILSVISGG